MAIYTPNKPSDTMGIEDYLRMYLEKFRFMTL